MAQIQAQTVKDLSRGSWSQVLQHFGLPAYAVSGRHCECPKCGGTDRFRFSDMDGDGSVICNQCATNVGDGIGALQWLLGCSFREALHKLADYHGLSNGNGHATQPRPTLVSTPKQTAPPTDPDTSHRGYSALLARLPLSPKHREDHRRRGLSDEAIDRGGYRTFTDDANERLNLAGDLCAELGADYDKVPGFTRNPSNPFPFPAGLLIPVRDAIGRIIALRVRRDDPGDGSKYLWVSSASRGGPSPGAPVHVPIGITAAERIRVTEGELKADVATHLSSMPTISIAGVNTHKRAIPVLRELGAKVAVLAFDADRSKNKAVAAAQLEAVETLAAEGFAVELETWPADWKGIDDLLLAGGVPTVITGPAVLEAARADLAAAEAAAAAAKKAEGESGEPAGQTEAAAAPVDDNEVTNATVELVDDENGGEKRVTVPLPINEILRRIREQTKGWPRRVEQNLFVVSGKSVHWLGSPAELFGWLGAELGRVIPWHRVTGCVSKEEAFGEFRRTAQAYRAVESIPHEPRFADHFYTCDDIAPGDDSALAGLLKWFAPEADEDAELIRAAFATPMWGGPGGTRPVFVITSADGRGAGKSKFAELVASLYGGDVQLSAREPIDALKTRILSAEALGKRIAILDNVKSLKFSWAELEGLITAREISGRRLYVGEASRPNTLTTFITLNGASLSTDMAQRSIIIRIRRPIYSGDWEEGVKSFIETNRAAILADVLAMLRRPAMALAKFSRWGLWEKSVLSRLANATAVQAAILERQKAADVEGEEHLLLEEHFSRRIASLGFEECDRVHLPIDIVTAWYNAAMNERERSVSVSRLITQAIDEGATRQLRDNPSRKHGRGFIWVGEKVGISSAVRYDIREKISELEKFKAREKIFLEEEAKAEITQTTPF